MVELLNPDHVDRESSNWWITSDQGLWGDTPFLHLGERFWDEAHQISSERFHTVHLESGAMDEVLLCHQIYSVEAARSLLTEAGFARVDVYPGWDSVAVHDATKWIVYVAHT